MLLVCEMMNHFHFHYGQKKISFIFARLFATCSMYFINSKSRYYFILESTIKQIKYNTSKTEKQTIYLTTIFISLRIIISSIFIWSFTACFEPGRKLVGNKLYQFPNNEITSKEKCKIQCQSRIRCKSFNYDQGQQKCILKNYRPMDNDENMKNGWDFQYFGLKYCEGILIRKSLDDSYVRD